MERTDDTLVGIVTALSLHGVLVILFVLSNLFSSDVPLPDGNGEPVTASIMISATDIRRLQKSIHESEAVPPPRPAPEVQPMHEPKPQTSKVPQQTPTPVINPDSVDQEPISELAIEQTEEKIVAEREARRQQVQIDLTEDVKKQEMAERNQRLQEQQLADLEAMKLAQKSEENSRSTEDQRLQQLQDMQASDDANASPVSAPAASGGNPNEKNGLMARYKAAIKATIQSNWRHDNVQPLERCEVEFTQAPGGEVIDVTFVSCSFSPEGRSGAERAVRLTPLPYYGFEPVFEDRQEFTLCYPAEQCEG